MPRKGFRKVTREELVRELRWLARHRARVTQRDFAKHLKCSPDAIHQHFSTWRELRREAGICSPRAMMPRHLSDRDLLDEYLRLRDLLGRPPLDADFERLGRCRYLTLQRRFGDDAAIHRRVSTYEAFAKAGGCSLPPETGPRNGREQIREVWKGLRYGFALHSSDLRDVPAERFDVIVCLRHDWPGCPWVALELGELGLSGDTNVPPCALAACKQAG